jgi:hypothetical protein
VPVSVDITVTADDLIAVTLLTVVPVELNDCSETSDVVDVDSVVDGWLVCCLLPLVAACITVDVSVNLDVTVLPLLHDTVLFVFVELATRVDLDCVANAELVVADMLHVKTTPVVADGDTATMLEVVTEVVLRMVVLGATLPVRVVKAPLTVVPDIVAVVLSTTVLALLEETMFVVTDVETRPVGADIVAVTLLLVDSTVWLSKVVPGATLLTVVCVTAEMDLLTVVPMIDDSDEVSLGPEVVAMDVVFDVWL